MRPSEAARQAGTSPDTLKRWLKQYREYFTPSATPLTGRSRQLTAHDQRLAIYIASLRNADLSYQDIQARLEEARANEWEDLPPLPQQGAENIPSDVAAARAREMVENALLSRELAHARDQLQALTTELETAHTNETSQAGRIHELELALERARGQVAQLEARLSGYALGGERAIAPALLMLIMLVSGAALILIAFLALRLAG